MSESKYKSIVTPIGTAYYPHLFTPAVFEGKELGYEVTVVFDDEYTEKLKGLIKAELKNAKESEAFKGKRWKKEPLLSFSEKDVDDEVFKGATAFKFKMKPTGTNSRTGEKFKRTVAVFDSKRNVIKKANIGNGTTMRICAQIVPYYVSSTVNGIGLYMEAVQIIDLKEWTGIKDAESYGFDNVEEGYIADEPMLDEAGNVEEGYIADEPMSDEEADF